jgi:hypothetical protein
MDGDIMFFPGNLMVFRGTLNDHFKDGNVRRFGAVPMILGP